jgi:hypothetical protein
MFAAQGSGTLSGSFASIPQGSTVNLTTVGKLDWIHWGLYTETSLNRKSQVSPMISDFNVLGDWSCSTCFIGYYQYSDNWNGYTWYDGAPIRSVESTPTGIWVYNYPNAVGSGFSFTAPADPTPRTLLVYVGAFAAQGQLRATLSDGSAQVFTSLNAATVNNLGNGPSGVFTLNYSAANYGQLLTVTWKESNPRASGANVTLQAAALTAPGADNPPFVVVTNPVNHASFPEPATVTVGADAQDFDGTITNVSFYSGTNILGQRTAPPFNFTSSNLPRGIYNVSATATDDSGVTSQSMPIQFIVYGSGGSQSSDVQSSAYLTDLSAEGTADWFHWGLDSETGFDTKDLPARQISNFTVLGDNSVQRFDDSAAAGFSWSDGTPTFSADSITTGVSIAGLTNGFQLTAPASRTPRQLKVYVGGYGVQADFQAYLSDFSANSYCSDCVSNMYSGGYMTYTINYTAASAGQQLIVVYQASSVFDLAYGNVALQAATLQADNSFPIPVSIMNPQQIGKNFTFSFSTELNHSYAAQYADSLPTSNWVTFTNVGGTGNTLSVTNQNIPTTRRYYRVQTQ